MLTEDDLERYVAERRLPATLVRLADETPTVSAAAAAVRVPEAAIVKSLLFLVRGEPLLVVANGLARVDPRRVAARLGVGAKQVRLADAATVLALTGYPAGAVPPFGHRAPLRTWIDRRVLAQPEVYAGGGGIRALLRVNPATIAEHCGADVVDVVAELAT
jgi:prolyl-tRNA editing enzyme YbaK/EbsC (Cys-tRNA(Pro) deacylase)